MKKYISLFICVILVLAVAYFAIFRTPFTEHQHTNADSDLSDIRSAISASIDEYDTSVNVTKDGEALHISVSVLGGQTIYKSSFADVVTKAKGVIETLNSKYEISQIEFHGTGNEKALTWKTKDFSSGVFYDVDAGDDAKVIKDMSYDKLLDYCEYKQ